MARDEKLDPKSVVIPGHGNVLVSTGDTAEPFDIGQFQIGDESTYGEGWMSLGYTSKENTIEFDKDGGDATSVDAWEEDGLDTSYESTLWSFVVRALSMSKDVFELAFNGGAWDDELDGYAMGDVTPIEKSVMIIFAHAGKRAGIYIRRAKLASGEAPSIDVEQFFEIEIKGDVLASDSAKYKKIFWYKARPETKLTPGS
ncbi:hypothetical protein [Kocuria massiliensis]|uniref:phage tail tube protein n=1 Tax=Kocuria massiliensis TaxID=1926282 RepID=UPI0022B9D16F|nr:hypothetical protein [Kocuria massiliensis]